MDGVERLAQSNRECASQPEGVQWACQLRSNGRKAPSTGLSWTSPRIRWSIPVGQCVGSGRHRRRAITDTGGYGAAFAVSWRSDSGRGSRLTSNIGRDRQLDRRRECKCLRFLRRQGRRRDIAPVAGRGRGPPVRRCRHDTAGRCRLRLPRGASVSSRVLRSRKAEVHRCRCREWRRDARGRSLLAGTSVRTRHCRYPFR